jgi:NAD(P)-dependent dehydrogenase (short-subunit alcohol dehydrogenase family)
MSANAQRIAIVTGGGSGIGAAVALALADDAWTVVLAGRHKETLDEVVARGATLSGTLESVRTDVTDETSVRQLFTTVLAEHGRVDLLFNNAGIGSPAVDIDDLELDAWNQVVAVNLTGAFLCTREAFRVMRNQQPRGGRIINNGSLAAHAPRPRSIAYTATKHAITGLTKSTSLDGRAFDIACGQIDIGNAATDMASGAGKGAGAAQADGSVRAEPLMDVAEVGRAVRYMASLSLDANVASLMVLPPKMPFLGRG